ncbi:hypothetical protein Taro_056090 [Colocasia esculenta]|uniref:GIR1-like zinc ribbon domain-containing protein n=1 Tax=Colocasia esculenta TaxID=4460 RepID=A0A843XSL5_COLES|nr:hypothetical protein [Colocasia esculenta]
MPSSRGGAMPHECFQGDGIQHRAPRCLAFVCCEPDASPSQLLLSNSARAQGRRSPLEREQLTEGALPLQAQLAAGGQAMEGQAPARNARGAAGNRRPDQATAPVVVAAARRASSSSTSQGSSYSSASSSVTSDASSPIGGGEVEAGSPAMVLRGCPRCFMYVMVQVQRQRCPRCNTSALVRLFDG